MTGWRSPGLGLLWSQITEPFWSQHKPKEVIGIEEYLTEPEGTDVVGFGNRQELGVDTWSILTPISAPLCVSVPFVSVCRPGSSAPCSLTLEHTSVSSHSRLPILGSFSKPNSLTYPTTSKHPPWKQTYEVVGSSHTVKLQLQRKTPADRNRQFLDYVGAEPGRGNTQCKHYADEKSSESNRRRNGDAGQLTQQILYACTYNSQKYVCPYMRVYVYIHTYTNKHLYLT